MASALSVSRNGDVAGTVFLLDVSSSMIGRKIEVLKKTLANLWPEYKARLLVFSDSCRWIDSPTRIPQPDGSTDLTGALEMAAAACPSQVIVISDGLPNCEESALEAADLIPGVIDVFFCGDDEDRDGAEFLRKLARRGGGRFAHKDLGKGLAIGQDLRGMLALAPPPIAL